MVGKGSRDWTGVDIAFPSGMADLAAYIKEKGLIPGIWIAPHGQSNDSVVMANPGVFLFKPDSTTASIHGRVNGLWTQHLMAGKKYFNDLFTRWLTGDMIILKSMASQL